MPMLSIESVKVSKEPASLSATAEAFLRAGLTLEPAKPGKPLSCDSTPQPPEKIRTDQSTIDSLTIARY